MRRAFLFLYFFLVGGGNCCKRQKAIPFASNKRIARMTFLVFGRMPHYFNEIYSIKLNRSIDYAFSKSC